MVVVLPPNKLIVVAGVEKILPVLAGVSKRLGFVAGVPKKLGVEVVVDPNALPK